MQNLKDVIPRNKQTIPLAEDVCEGSQPESNTEKMESYTWECSERKCLLGCSRSRS